MVTSPWSEKFSSGMKKNHKSKFELTSLNGFVEIDPGFLELIEDKTGKSLQQG